MDLNISGNYLKGKLIKRYKNNINSLLKIKDKIIVIDCQPVQFEYRGIGKWAREFLEEIMSRKTYFFFLIVNNSLSNIEQNCPFLKNKSNFSKIKINRLTRDNLYIRKIKLMKVINSLSPYMFLCISPFQNGLSLSHYVQPEISILKKDIITCSIIHDLIPLKTKTIFNKSSKIKDNYFKTLLGLKNYDCLMANSNFTKNDCISNLKQLKYLGTGYNHTHYDVSNIQTKITLTKYNISEKKYIFIQSGFGLNKGFLEFIKEYHNISEEIKNDIKLVFGTYSIPDYLLKFFEDENIEITGFLTEEEKFILHENSWLYVGSSTYEGFGFSLVEAMNHDKPVIANNCTSFPEIIEDDRFLFTYKNNSCSELINKLYNDESFYNECVENSKKRKHMFSWKNIVTNFLLLIENKILS